MANTFVMLQMLHSSRHHIDKEKYETWSMRIQDERIREWLAKEIVYRHQAVAIRRVPSYPVEHRAVRVLVQVSLLSCQRTKLPQVWMCPWQLGI